MSRTPSSTAAVDLRSAPGRLPGARFAGVVLAAMISVLLALALGNAGPAGAAGAQVDLGTVGTYSVVGGQTVTNTGPSRLNADLGVSPGTAITGFPPGRIGGSRHAADANALQAQSDLTIAYNDAAGRAPTGSVAGDLVGQTKVAGVYNSTGPLALSGTLTLDAQGDPNAVFIFQIASTLTTATASYVNMINGAQACNVFWQVGSSATLGTASVFRGSILALTSISVTTDAVVQGRALARNGAVTLDNDTFTSPACGSTTAATPTTTTASVTPKSTASGTTTTLTATVIGATKPTGTVVVTSGRTVAGTAPVDGTGHATLTLPAGTKVGTKHLTATYGGSTTLLPSTSRPTTLTVTAAPVRPPVRPSVTPASTTHASTSSSRADGNGTTAAGASATPTSSGSALAATGPTHLGVQLTAVVSLLALGAVLTTTANRYRRHHPKHRG